MKFKSGDRVIHFKGKEYTILCSAINSETNEELIIYRAEYGDFNVYARPTNMFESEVDKSKYPNCKQKYRFELI